MGIEAAASEIGREAHVIWAARWLYLASLAVLGTGIWKAVAWQFSARIERLKQDVESEHAEVERLRGLPKETAAPAGHEDRPTSQTSIEVPTGPDVIRSLEQALEVSRGAVASIDSPARDVERVLPVMKAALLTAHKRYGIPLTPPFNQPNHPIALELSRRLIEKIIPLLKEGHAAEAREEAAAYIAALPSAGQPKPL